MNNRIRSIAMLLLLICFFGLELASSVTTGQEFKTEGLIVARQKDSFTLRAADRTETTVLVTDYTKIAIPRGWFRKKAVSSSSLVPGLWVKVEGVGNTMGQVIAKTVRFSDNDLRTANAIQAGLAPLESKVGTHETQLQAHAQNIQANQQDIQRHQQQIQTNKQDIEANQQRVTRVDQRVSDLGNYDVMFTNFVYFGIGDARLTQQAERDLLDLANRIRDRKGYVLQVRGYADSKGRTAMNDELSWRRAQSVIIFLTQYGKIPPTQLLIPGAMGETAPVASNETLKGRAENRRAEIKVLVNRGYYGY